MKNLILLFGLVLIFSCQREEKDFPMTLEEITDFENQVLDKKVETCESEIARLLCKGNWQLDSFGFEGLYSEVEDNSSLYFDRNGTCYFEKASKVLNWQLNSDTLIFDCFYKMDERGVFSLDFHRCSSKHKYLTRKNGDKLILKLIDIYHKIEGGAICNCPAPDVKFQPSILPYLDSINTSK